MMPSSIFQPASAGLREGAPRAGTVQPVKSLPLKSGFHDSADFSDGRSTKQSSVTMPKEMPFIGVLPPWNSKDVERGTDRNLLFAVRFILEPQLFSVGVCLAALCIRWRNRPSPPTSRRLPLAPSLP